MKLLGKIIFSVFSNAMALLVADYFIVGFSFSGDFQELIILAIILTTINIFLMPIVRLFFGPLIIISLGLFVVVINATAIYALDILSSFLTIEGIVPLLIATLIFGVVNMILGFGAKSKYKQMSK